MIFWHLQHSHGLYNTLSRPLLALSRPLLALSRPLLVLSRYCNCNFRASSTVHYTTSSGSLQALCCRYNNLKVCFYWHSHDLYKHINGLYQPSRPGPFDFYKPDLTTSTLSHEFYSTLTASIGTFMISILPLEGTGTKLQVQSLFALSRP